MTSLLKINLGTAPTGQDGDANRAANTKMNSNVDVLNTQAALTTATTITSSQALTTAHVGKRVPFFSAAVINAQMPSAAACAADQVILLRNAGSAVVNLTSNALTPGDGIGLSRLNPQESVLMITDGVSKWDAFLRGRSANDNETVNGTLTVNGGIAGNLSATGKLNGLNKPNLLVNGSGELGNVGWQSSNYTSVLGSVGEGYLFTNPAAINSTIVDVSVPFAMGAGVLLNLSGEIDSHGMTAGHAVLDIQCYTSAMAVIGTIATCVVNFGQSYVPVSLSGTTPAGTAFVAVRRYCDTSPVATAFGVIFRRIKVEGGSTASLNSPEASLAALAVRNNNLSDLASIPTARANLGVGKVLLSTPSIAGINRAVFALPAGYDLHELEINSVIPSGSASEVLGMALSADGGATWIGSANYNWVLNQAIAGGSSPVIGTSTAQTYWTLSGGHQGSSSTRFSSTVKLRNFLSGTPIKLVDWTGSAYLADQQVRTISAAGHYWGAQGTINAVSIWWLNGATFAGGSISLYGVLK